MTGLPQPERLLPAPFSLIAELTHRCPLHCLYCSNPIEMQRAEEELSTEDWIRVFRQAAQLGILHVHFTGGEPLARKDLPELIQAARDAGLYVNIITSGVGLTEARLSSLVEAGLDHLQLSLQDIEEVTANHVAGTRDHARSDSNHQALSYWLHHEPGRPPPEPRPVGGVHRPGRDAWPGPVGDRARPVLWLGAQKSRSAHAHGRAGPPLDPDCGCGKEEACGENPPGSRCSGLLRKLSQALHGRLGKAGDAHRSDRPGTSMPCGGGDPGHALSKCSNGRSLFHLEFLLSLPALSRRCLDARRLQELRAQGTRLRRMPMPGDASHQ